MRGLNKKLPPFSSDIAGACASLFGMGGVVVVHEPACCTSCYTSYDEPRYYGSSSPLYSSELREIHLSTGDDETILRRIEAAVKIIDCRFIAIIGSPIPMFAGTDYNALARETEKRTGIPSIAVETGGFDRYDKGASKALLQLARKFIPPVAKRELDDVKTGEIRKINIIGAVAMDGIRIRGTGGLAEYYTHKGIEINSVFTDGSSVVEVLKAGAADQNVVISVSGLSTAEYLKNSFGIPYTCGIPIYPPGSYEPANGLKIGKGLIIGDQIISNSIRNCLCRDFGIPDIRVASFFSMNERIMQPGDCRLDGEIDLEKMLADVDFDFLIGDPAFLRFIEDYPEKRFISLPHTPVSGFSPLREDPVLVGEAGFRFFESRLAEWG